MIPEWVRDWGFLVVAAVAVTALIMAAHIGHVYGAGYGWALLIIAACVVTAVWWQDYSRRAEAARVRKEQALYVLNEIEKVDIMTGDVFEAYCADLLRALGYQEVEVIGSTPGEDGADIIATDPPGVKVAVQCKRWARTVGPNVIRELAGTVAFCRHHGRAGIVMTNALASREAHRWAVAAGIRLVDRPVLQQWMGQARAETEKHGLVPGAPGARRPRGLRPAAKATTAALSAALVLLAVIAFQQPIPRSLAKATAPVHRPAFPDPGTVVREAFAAINTHHWRTLWRLSSHPDHGRGKSYRKMIAGYRLTARDVVTSLKARGQTVTARVDAYETTGTIQTFDFTYKVHSGKIISGHAVLLDTSRPGPKSPSKLPGVPRLWE
jgi:restriction system protein